MHNGQLSVSPWKNSGKILILNRAAGTSSETPEPSGLRPRRGKKAEPMFCYRGSGLVSPPGRNVGAQ